MCLQKKMDEFIDRKNLDALSYRSSLGQSLKQISLRKTPLHFNTWSHQYIYKYRSPEVGRRLYAAYLAGKITSEEDFRHSIENEVI